MHFWADDALRHDVPKAAKELLDALENCTLGGVNHVDAVKIMEAKLALIQALDDAGMPYKTAYRTSEGT